MFSAEGTKALTLGLQKGEILVRNQANHSPGSAVAAIIAYRRQREMPEIRIVRADSSDDLMLDTSSLLAVSEIAWSGYGRSVIYSGQGNGPKPAFESRHWR